MLRSDHASRHLAAVSRKVGLYRFPISAYARREVTVSAGPFRVGLRLQEGLTPQRNFIDQPGLSPDVMIDVRVEDGAHFPQHDGYLRRDAQGFVFASPCCYGEFDWRNSSGSFAISSRLVESGDDCRSYLVELARSVVLDEVLRRGGLALHGCALQLDGAAVVICGASERGKTTLFQRFVEDDLRGRDRDLALADEWSFLVPGDGGLWHYWWFPHLRGVSRPRPPVLPLASVVELSARRDRTATRRLSLVDATRSMIKNAYFLRGVQPQLVLSAANELASNVPIGVMSHDLQTPVAALEAALIRFGARQ